MSTFISKGVASTLATLPSSTLSANITSSQTHIPLVSTTNFSSYTTAKIASTSEIVTYTGTATNNLRLSENFVPNSAVWQQTAVSWSYNTIIAPDGTLTASAATLTALNGDSGIFQYNGITQTAAGAIFSVFLQGVGASIGKKITLVIYGGSPEARLAQQVTLTSGWTRYSMISTQTSGNILAIVVPWSNTYAGMASELSVGDTFNIFGMQLEHGTTLGGYVPTGLNFPVSALTGVTRGANSTTAAAATSGATVTVIDNNINKAHFVNCVATAGATTIRVTDISDTTLGELYLHNSGDSIIIEKSPSDNILLVGGAAKVSAVGSPRS